MHFLSYGTIPETAQALGISRPRVYQLLEAQSLCRILMGGRTLVGHDDRWREALRRRGKTEAEEDENVLNL